MLTVVSKPSHLLRIHPLPFTPALEAVRSALWAITEPIVEVRGHRKLVLDIMQVAQDYLIELFEDCE